MDKKSLQEAVEILTLFNALEPAAANLIKELAADLSGKSDAEILADSDAIYQSVIDKAKAKLGQS